MIKSNEAKVYLDKSWSFTDDSDVVNIKPAWSNVAAKSYLEELLLIKVNTS